MSHAPGQWQAQESCPACHSNEVVVADSRFVDGQRRRRRVCRACDHRWGTVEVGAEHALQLRAKMKRLDRLIAELVDLRDSLVEDGIVVRETSVKSEASDG